MTTIKCLASRGTNMLMAFAFVAAVFAPVAISQQAFAAGQFSPRKLTLSSAANGTVSTDANGTTLVRGTGGNGAFANHAYDFTTGTAGSIQSVLLQYCTTPLLDTTCTSPTGMDASTITSIAAQSGFGATAATLDTATSVTTGGIFTANPCTSRAHCITLQRTGGASVAAAAALTASFGTGTGTTNWIKNPTTIGTFYVRIYTFSDNTYTTQIDSGAVAASTAEKIDITAKVQEKLNFSVAAATVAPTASCTALSGTGAIPLGDAQGVLDIATAYAARSYFRLNTNAAGGTNILYSGDTLKTAGGTNSITALTSTAVSSSPGTSQFGLALDSSDTQAGSGYSFTNLTPTAPYAGGAGTITSGGTAQFAFNTASVTTPVQIAGVTNSTVACDTGSVRYLGNIGTTTRAGVYKTTITYIAVPTF